MSARGANIVVDTPYLKADDVFGANDDPPKTEPNAYRYDLDAQLFARLWERVSVNGEKKATLETLVKYAETLQEWMEGKLQQYDSDPKTKAKRDKKHGDRTGYEQHLQAEICAKLQLASQVVYPSSRSRHVAPKSVSHVARRLNSSIKE